MLDKLQIKIESNQIIRSDFATACDVDELLDMRDEDEFDSEWMRVVNDLNDLEVGEDEQKSINFIREKSFMMAYDLFDSSDIASCISDDFEIICKAILANYNDSWFNSLIMSYARGEFPCGRLEMTEHSIKECVDSFLL